MARSAQYDPYDKFRFRVTFYYSITELQTTDSHTAGFTEITLPKATTTEISYRENVSSYSFMKKPGLTRYEPVVLHRGVDENNYFYNWHNKIHNAAAALNTTLSALSALSIVPVQSPIFRKDVLISLLTRDGNTSKHWYLYNAFPIGYKPGNDLSASEDSKLIEEVTLAYEGFVEVFATADEDPLAKIRAQANQGLVAAGRAAAIGAITGGLF